jgi:hypothetical protein
MSIKMQKKEKRSMRGGDGAADFAKSVYGDAGQQHAGSQRGNEIAVGPAMTMSSTPASVIGGSRKRFSKKQRGGDGAADFAKAVYGDVGQQHAGTQNSNIIAMNNASVQADAQAQAQAPVANGAMKGGKKRNMLKRKFKIPAFLMYINPFSKSQKKGKTAKKRHGKTQKR